MDYICSNISNNERGHLTFAGCDVTELADKFGTPLYIMDEERIRNNCQTYVNAFRRLFPEGSMPLYASKANSFKELYRIVRSEGMGTDVVSTGEIYTAFTAGFDMENTFFHGNNKTDSDISFAMECGVGHIVADCCEEIEAIETECRKRGKTQKVLLRVTPGIDTHTYEAVNTGRVDSKFGSAIETGRAKEMCELILSKEHIQLEGFHCHVGSQVFEEDVFERTAEIMLKFIADIKASLGYEASCLNLGGGYGVRYVEEDPEIDIEKKIADVAASINEMCVKLGIKVPKIFMEPGRSIVADAGMTLYKVGSVKKIPGFKNYVSVDGGMADNPRFALYRSKYSVINASRAAEEAALPCTLAGRCCESGDIIAENILMPENTCRGDVAAVCTTGAYNYSMSSNYNRLQKPAVIMLKDGAAREVVKREGLADITRLDV